MRTNQDQIDIVFDKLRGTALQSAITGKLAKHVRPTNSNHEDVVINSLVTTNTQLQKGILNVNIHVPNIQATLEGGVVHVVPNHNRLNELTKIAIPLLKDVWGYDWDFDIEQINTIREDTSSFNNIRIAFQSINV